MAGSAYILVVLIVISAVMVYKADGKPYKRAADRCPIGKEVSSCSPKSCGYGSEKVCCKYCSYFGPRKYCRILKLCVR